MVGGTHCRPGIQGAQRLPRRTMGHVRPKGAGNRGGLVPWAIWAVPWQAASSVSARHGPTGWCPAWRPRHGSESLRQTPRIPKRPSAPPLTRRAESVRSGPRFRPRGHCFSGRFRCRQSRLCSGTNKRRGTAPARPMLPEDQEADNALRRRLLHDHGKAAPRRRQFAVGIEPPETLVRPSGLVPGFGLRVLQSLGCCHSGVP
jgi:hypothetical protein